MNTRSVADIVGPWVDPEYVTNLVARCRDAWNIPIRDLSNEMLATFLRQEIATDWILEEATKRLNAGVDDDSEMYEGELAENVQEACERRRRRA
jgi:CDI immunity proteins